MAVLLATATLTQSSSRFRFLQPVALRYITEGTGIGSAVMLATNVSARLRECNGEVGRLLWPTYS